MPEAGAENTLATPKRSSVLQSEALASVGRAWRGKGAGLLLTRWAHHDKGQRGIRCHRSRSGCSARRQANRSEQGSKKQGSKAPSTFCCSMPPSRAPAAEGPGWRPRGEASPTGSPAGGSGLVAPRVGLFEGGGPVAGARGLLSETRSPPSHFATSVR